MSGFQPVTFSPAGVAKEIAENAAKSLEELKTTIEDGAQALAELDLKASLEAGLAQLMDELRSQVAGALASPAKFLAVTPFQHTVGTRAGEYAFLTAENALKVLSDRFGDGVGEGGALLVLIVASATQGGLAEALGAFNKVYPIAELEKAQRRAKALATLETDKFVIPKGGAFPPWKAAAPVKDITGRAMAKSLGGMVAQGEGLARGAVAPLEQLSSFAAKQTGKILEKIQDFQKLAESMTGGFEAWAGFYFEGGAADIAKALASLVPPFDAAFKCVTLLCWSGSPEEVRYYKETFGL